VLNVPLPPGTGGSSFHRVFEEKVIPALDEFRPELLFLSAGFDAHQDDPLANLELHEEDFAQMTAELVAVAERHAQGRVVSVLEGGYDVDALERSVAAHLWALAGEERPRQERTSR
jgi:acetoin utilization deacetylase AcuC-like enzyme